MNLRSHLTERLQHLPPPITRDVVVRRDLVVPMRDGAELLADHWAPRNVHDALPTALVRIPYGRRGVVADQTARPLAERGFQVLVQSTRGTFGSDGPFDPLRRERDDGLDTIDWVIAQPWFSDALVLVGSSYLGFAQWAVVDEAPPQVKAMIPAVTESALTREFLRRDGFSLEVLFNWGVQVDGQERPLAMARQLLAAKRVQRALTTLPLNRADQVALGHTSQYVQDVLAHDSQDEFWEPLDHRARVPRSRVPASLVGGWFDVFLPGQLRDFTLLQQAQRTARLTVGPWAHADFLHVGGAAVREALDFGLAHAQNRPPTSRAPVRLYVMGHEPGWRDFPAWPPPDSITHRLHLASQGRLTADEPGDEPPDTYRYDPADPTPAVGGIRLAPGVKAGPVDNTALEARPDVLTFTTDPLEDDLEVIGEVGAQIWFRSSRASADVFVRLCDVDGRGRSRNVTDGLVRLEAADRVGQATVQLWPTAYRFRRGHRLRVQVSSGAFPRYDRNPGTGEPRATATTLHAAEQHVYHDRQHPSAIILSLSTSSSKEPRL